jgi:hypothetical protein
MKLQSQYSDLMDRMNAKYYRHAAQEHLLVKMIKNKST